MFRGHWARASEDGRAESIAVNFRSRGELLEAIDRCFASVWDGFEPLRPGARARRVRASSRAWSCSWSTRRSGAGTRRSATDDPFGAAMHGLPAWRAAEARLLAKRVDQLRAEGGWEWRDIVLLFRATTSIGFYERALEERGIPTHVVGGRGYWAQQQVADLRHWLAALANPLDELAVYSVLASPLGGLSLDAVALIGLEAKREKRDPWWVLRESGELLDLLPAADRRRVAAFVELFEAERRAAPQVSLETLIDRAVTRTGYDRHVLGLPAGTRRMANVRKLMRMAREYEADEGRDLRGFIDTLAERDVVQPREGEAPLEAEALDAVRLMTVHRAKGLEFPVVCVADLGKEGREDDARLRISEDGLAGLRLASLGRRSDRQRAAGGDEEARQGGRRAGGEAHLLRGRRRARKEHLVLSGATDLEEPKEPEDMKEPMRWLLRGFPGPAVARDRAEAGGAWTSCCRQADRVPARRRVRSRSAATPSPSWASARSPRRGRCRSAGSPTAGSRPTGAARTASTSSGRCACRASSRRSRPEALPEAGLGALLRGTLVHELLERLDFGRPLVPGRRGRGRPDRGARRHGAARGGGRPARHGRAVRGVGAARAHRRAPTRVRTELPFAFTLAPPGAGGRSLLVNGVVDVHAAEADGLLVVDYKSDALDGRDPAELTAESYSTQRLVYALAGLRGGRGAGRGGPLLPRAARAAGGRRATPPATPIGSRRSCSSSPPGWSRAASCPAPARIWSCAATVRDVPRCAPGTSSTRSRAADLSFRQVPHLLCG